jgi:hypothetical protein
MTFLNILPRELCMLLNNYVEYYSILVEHRLVINEIPKPQPATSLPQKTYYITDVEFCDLIFYDNYCRRSYVVFSIVIFLTRDPDLSKDILNKIIAFMNTIKSLNSGANTTVELGLEMIKVKYKYVEGFHVLEIRNKVFIKQRCTYYFRNIETILNPFNQIMLYLKCKIG